MQGKVLGDTGRTWVAVVELDGFFVRIEAATWPLVKAQLVTIHDLSVYEAGSRTIENRPR
jgi:hypothetical protein